MLVCMEDAERKAWSSSEEGTVYEETRCMGLAEGEFLWQR